MKSAIFACIKRSWWVMIILIACLSLYNQAVKRKMRAIATLEEKFEELERERILACSEKEDLDLRMHSVSDPMWIEMILMKKLGVVPEGYLKVHFIRD